MIVVIHLVGGRSIVWDDIDFTQEHVNNLFNVIDQKEKGMIQYTEVNGKKYIVPLDKILYIETNKKL